MNIFQKNRLIFGEDYDEPAYGDEEDGMYYSEVFDTGYCKNCGREVRPVKVRVVCEDYDYPRTGMKDAYRSKCCGEELSPDPITDVCAMCGETAEMDGEGFEVVDGDKMCQDCLKEHFHNLEREI